ncbi:hypothetical protein ASPZODRAFT_147604 [Penicilliopsis zonata CBS 506.65]|uniref:Uncharacterized protein n=1 Tax=Penicilliopsis zonata CBS 506.65 TaxID=1073090 RepID=A0A1L9S577_9EURO|nr:hypothetical protein ASPZODRAFT_147604 [Penicilliopsis zonata CBS 506.65]OJJ42301.1 hypothetical protein ASPZODRAFT_147604 [Penicilliopsis zonata CBS 506.65]
MASQLAVTAKQFALWLSAFASELSVFASLEGVFDAPATFHANIENAPNSAARTMASNSRIALVTTSVASGLLFADTCVWIWISWSSLRTSSLSLTPFSGMSDVEVDRSIVENNKNMVIVNPRDQS